MMKVLFSAVIIAFLLVACDTPKPRPRGEAVYNQSCVSCHERGQGGAPVRGDKREWDKRMEKGQQALVDNVIQGYKTMPKKGACFSCSDEEIRLAVEYLLKSKN